MIITRTPFRMSFFGGGSDLPTFYETNGGAVLSTSINKYMYINIHQKFTSGIRLAYSRVEEVSKYSEIQHPIVRNVLEYFGKVDRLEITSIADIPAKGTGLGSSSSYTVGLVKAISTLMGKNLSRSEIAELACHIEIELCGDPIGKQDQYAASYGGMNVFEFTKNGVNRKPVQMGKNFSNLFSSSLVSVYTGSERSAAQILRQQTADLATDENKIAVQKQMVSMVYEAYNLVQNEDILGFGELLHESWKLKKKLSNAITNQRVDEIYETGLSAGAYGGKLLGAGAAGFVTFVVPFGKLSDVKNSLSKFKFVDLLPENSGVKTVYNDWGYQ